MIRTLRLGLAVIFVFGCRPAKTVTVEALGGKEPMMFCAYAREDFVELSRLVGCEDQLEGWDMGRARNTSGSEVILWFRRGDHTKVVFLSSGGLRTRDLRRESSGLGETDPRVWMESETCYEPKYRFSDGTLLSGAKWARFTKSVGGNYFTFMTEADYPHYTIRSFRRPDRPAGTIPSMNPTHLFEKEGGIYIFGDREDGGRPIICILFKEWGGGLRKAKEWTIDVPSGLFPGGLSVEDMSPTTEHVVVRNWHGVPLKGLDSLFMFDLSTGRTRRIGLAGWFGFFLQQDYVRNWVTEHRGSAGGGKGTVSEGRSGEGGE